MSKASKVLHLAAAALLAHPLSVVAQPVERSVYVSVVDRAGEPMIGLGTHDFVVREDGVGREVLRVARAKDPMRIAVLVDTSQAAEPYVADLRAALKSFIAEMKDQHDIAVFGFGDRPTLFADYTRDAARLDAAVGRVFAHRGSGAYLLDAIVEVSQGLSRAEGTRAAIVVLTAEGAEFSDRHHSVPVDAVQAADVTLHSLVLSRPGGAFLNEAAREREFALSIGAARTGGRREDVLIGSALPGRAKALAGEIVNQYKVVYSRPETLLPPQTIDVEVRQENATVRTPRATQRRRATS
jgi:VWFA-related protein